MKKLPTDVDWSYEIKFDGYRALALLHKGQVELLSRNDKPFLKFPSLTEALSRLPVKTAILDGEIVALDDRGIPSFQLLQNHNDEPLAFYAFDLLELNGVDWKERKLVDRRQNFPPCCKERRHRFSFPATCKAPHASFGNRSFRNGKG